MEEPEKIVSQTELDDKAQKLVEDKDADSRLRVYIGPMEKALTAVLLIWAAFQVWANMFGTLGAVKLRTAHIMFLLPLAFTLYPTFKKERRRRRFMPVWDIALIAAAILSYGYLFLRYDAVARTGRLNATDVWVGVVCLLVAFEAARRASGNLAVIALVFLSYFAVWGQYIPARSARAPLRSSASSRRWCGIPTAFSVRARAFPRRISLCSYSLARFSNTAAFPNSSTISR